MAKSVFKGRKIIFLFMLIFISFPESVLKNDFPTFRVVLDPGHGGRYMTPVKKHGDRYDTISQTYLDGYNDGAAGWGLSEERLMYSIARKTESLLLLCSDSGDFNRFARILKKYSSDPPERIRIITGMSRERSLSRKERHALDDPNAAYRLFDYPGTDGKMQKGRISRINDFRPHLVVSLHCAGSAPVEYRGMNPVLAAPYDFMHKGFCYLKGERKDRTFFHKSGYRHWFCESVRRSEFRWFLNDTSLYFTGFPLRKDLSVKEDCFTGYRYNMVRWKYRDTGSWEGIARFHPPRSKYSSDYSKFVPYGGFWRREKSIYESYRRDNGEEGFGGDNAYASYEIIRYILYSLFIEGYSHPGLVPGKPYVSVWIMPIHVNAINAFLELGYFSRSKDRYILKKKQDRIAEGIAVGIYSLFAGMRPKTESFRYRPRGKRIDLMKYNITTDKSYFDAVSD